MELLESWAAPKQGAFRAAVSVLAQVPTQWDLWVTLEVQGCRAGVGEASPSPCAAVGCETQVLLP